MSNEIQFYTWMHYRGCEFSKIQKEYKENFDDAFLHWVETGVLSLDRMAAEPVQEPVLKSITVRTYGVIIPLQQDHTTK